MNRFKAAALVLSLVVPSVVFAAAPTPAQTAAVKAALAPQAGLYRGAHEIGGKYQAGEMEITIGAEGMMIRRATGDAIEETRYPYAQLELMEPQKPGVLAFRTLGEDRKLYAINLDAAEDWGIIVLFEGPHGMVAPLGVLFNPEQLQKGYYESKFLSEVLKDEQKAGRKLYPRLSAGGKPE